MARTRWSVGRRRAAGKVAFRGKTRDPPGRPKGASGGLRRVKDKESGGAARLRFVIRRQSMRSLFLLPLAALAGCSSSPGDVPGKDATTGDIPYSSDGSDGPDGSDGVD